MPSPASTALAVPMVVRLMLVGCTEAAGTTSAAPARTATSAATRRNHLVRRLAHAPPPDSASAGVSSPSSNLTS